jgi:hypothetical protein
MLELLNRFGLQPEVAPLELEIISVSFLPLDRAYGVGEAAVCFEAHMSADAVFKITPQWPGTAALRSPLRR